ncbi:AMP-binding protein [Neobacillus niacini]|uniref:AMP-binding protein n=1 Tax=Neobacillus niacini TaxID=86668 RepID=UPI00286758C6|nr:AMP-binding protein [Neobacillus niacini]MDR6999953.1 long-chain acyl-CoA synthetase [Neobacillus niacini]
MTSITDSYASHAQKFPEKMAVLTAAEGITYQEWDERVCQTANWFGSFHFPNRTVAILLPNGVPFLQLFTGAAAAGWTAVPFDLKWTESEVEKRLKLSKASLIITTQKRSASLKKLRLPAQVFIWEECLEKIKLEPAQRTIQSNGELPFYMGFTSGTTGNPKAFIRSHKSWLASFECNRVDFQMNENDHILIHGALIHSHFLYGAISTLYLGGTVYLLEKYIPSQAMMWIETKPITVIYVVPTMISSLLKAERTIEKPLKILSSGAKWEEHSKNQVRSLFPNLTLYEFYGASELSFVTVLSDQEMEQKPDSVGRPCHNVKIEIRLEDSTLARPNEIGKIYVKSNMIFSGYLEPDPNTVQTENDWITVHDMGYLDEESYLHIVGREKNMILYGGINIFPEEIEKVLSLHHDVEEVAVVGLNDPYWGQIVTAVIKGSATKLVLQRLCKEKLAPFKIPRKWVFVDEMPYTSGGKIARRQVQELVESKVTSH